jgi:hypothetical protein
MVLGASRGAKELARPRRFEGIDSFEELHRIVDAACGSFPSKKRFGQGTWKATRVTCLKRNVQAVAWGRQGFAVVRNNPAFAYWHIHVGKRGDEYVAILAEVAMEMRKIKDQDILELFWEHLERTTVKELPVARLVVEQS